MSLPLQSEIDKARAAQAAARAERPVIRCPNCGSWVEGRRGEKTYCGICLEEVEVER